MPAHSNHLFSEPEPIWPTFGGPFSYPLLLVWLRNESGNGCKSATVKQTHKLQYVADLPRLTVTTAL